MTYSHTIYANESGRTLNSRDVCVSDSLLFVTSGNPSQVSVYNRFTEEYLCRLGDGSTSGSVQQANSVAVDSNFVYVRDQSELLKLFDRKEINEAIAKKQKNVSPKNIAYQVLYQSLRIMICRQLTDIYWLQIIWIRHCMSILVRRILLYMK